MLFYCGSTMHYVSYELERTMCNYYDVLLGKGYAS